MTPRAWIDRLLTVAVALAAGLFAWALVEAVRVTATRLDARDTAPATGDAPRDTAGTGAAGRDRAASTPRDLAAAITRNPFSAERRAPRVPYRLVSADTPVPAIAFDARPAELPLVLGTAVDANGASFAMCSYAGAPAVVVRVGDTIGPYTVVAIARARVTVRDADGTRLEFVSPDDSPGVQP